jgi:hypothetical protein
MHPKTKLLIVAVTSGFLAGVALLIGTAVLGKTPAHYNAPNYVNMNGTWQAENMSAVITPGNIEIAMTNNKEGISALYWKGTFVTDLVVTNISDVEIISQGDVPSMQASLFGSRDAAKTFIYKPGEKTLTFKLTMLGTTQVIKLKR